METKRVLKKGVRETFIVIILVIIAIFMGVITFKYYTNDKHKLSKLGYTALEIDKIIEKNKQDIILNRDYHSKLVDFITSKYYMDKNLDRYLSYYDANTDIAIDEIVAIVNVGADNPFYTNTKETDLSKGNSMLVNKYHKLNDSYEPDDITNISNQYAYEGQKIKEEVYDAYIAMFKAAKKQNLTIVINDSYRTLEEQEKSYKKYGDDYAARSGYSEHNTGLAIDIVSLTSNGDNFDTTEEFKWLSENAHLYGFILRYPKDKEKITGYNYESWHFRYLGDLARDVYNSNLTYDEYYAYYLEND